MHVEEEASSTPVSSPRFLLSLFLSPEHVLNRFDQDVGFALEDLLKVNFTLHSVCASTGEIGIDSRYTIDNMLTAREKLLETHVPVQESEQQGAPKKGGGRKKSTGGGSLRGGSSGGSVGSIVGGASDSGGSAGSMVDGGTRGGGGRRPQSARALRARQAKDLRKKKSSVRR